MRQFLEPEIDMTRRVELLNSAEASDEAVAAFMAALADDELVHALVGSERAGVLAIWGHSIGRLFRRIVAQNPFVDDETLTLLAADYDEAVSAAAYAALVLRAEGQADADRHARSDPA